MCLIFMEGMKDVYSFDFDYGSTSVNYVGNIDWR